MGRLEGADLTRVRCCRTHPELLDPPSPEEVASFVDPANNYAAPVMNPVDYVRSPGATMAMSSARKNIKKIQAELATTHEVTPAGARALNGLGVSLGSAVRARTRFVTMCAQFSLGVCDFGSTV